MPTISELAFRYNRVVLIIVVLLMIIGVISYFTLPAQEDPKITIREAVITTSHPGMTADKVELLITKTLEEAVRELPQLKEVRSVSMQGSSVIHVEILETYDGLDQIWDELRNELDQVVADLPTGTMTPFINDDFGDVAVLTVALLSNDTYSWGDQLSVAQHVRDMLFTVEGTKKIDLLGVQPERIYVEVSNSKIAQLGITPQQVIEALSSQNIITPGGVIDAAGEQFIIRPTGNFENISDIEDVLINIPGTQQNIILGDIASVTRRAVDPPIRTAYYNGRPAIIFSIVKDNDFNVLKYSPAIKKMLDQLQHTVPAGYELEIMTEQAVQVEKAIYGVTSNVLQTLAIVSALVILFLGTRTGLIVGAIVPGVILITLALISFAGMALERMSLATLIISLGLLVDNGIVVAEDFKKRLEDGEERYDALKCSGGSLAIPLLTSSLTTILVFLPLMLAESSAGEYTRSISIVILMSLITSWMLSITVTPYLCYHFIKITPPDEKEGLRAKVQAFFDKLNPAYESLLKTILGIRWFFIIGAVAMLLLSAFAMQYVPVKFFPDSDRSQVLVYLDLPAGSSMRETERVMQRIFTVLDDKKRFPHIKKFAGYGGFGGPRFVLSLAPIDPESSKGFIVLDIDKKEHQQQTTKKLRTMFADEFPSVRPRVTQMFLGPSDSSKIEVQVKGPDADYIYEQAEKIKQILADVPGSIDIKHDWENRIMELKVEVNQHQARRSGITSDMIATTLQQYFSGAPISRFREGDEIFPIIMRAKESERFDLGALESVNIYSPALQQSIPLMQVANVSYVNNYARIAREDLFRTITVEAKNLNMTAEDMVPSIDKKLQKLRDALPPAHFIEYDGVIEESKHSQKTLNANLPLCFGIIVILLIAQFNSYRRAAIILLTIPLVLIGAVIGLLALGGDFGFMVILGLYALAGIIVNNAIVLIDRIDIEMNELEDDSDNDAQYDALISACVRRLRPIIMSTTTTILGFLPLIISGDALFYAMSSAITFGLAVGTILTLGFVPVVYSLMFKIKTKKS